MFDSRRHVRELLTRSEERIASNILADRPTRVEKAGSESARRVIAVDRVGTRRPAEPDRRALVNIEAGCGNFTPRAASKGMDQVPTLSLGGAMTRWATDPLRRVRIASPCPADWDAMYGDDRVRFCSKCELNVFNLSAMTRAEAERLVVNREGRLCVRFYRRGDGTILTRDCPVGLRAIKRKAKRVVVACASLLVGTAVGGLANALYGIANSSYLAYEADPIRLQYEESGVSSQESRPVAAVGMMGVEMPDRYRKRSRRRR
jgi:hypothetical protein